MACWPLWATVTSAPLRTPTAGCSPWPCSRCPPCRRRSACPRAPPAASRARCHLHQRSRRLCWLRCTRALLPLAPGGLAERGGMWFWLALPLTVSPDSRHASCGCCPSNLSRSPPFLPLPLPSSPQPVCELRRGGALGRHRVQRLGGCRRRRARCAPGPAASFRLAGHLPDQRHRGAALSQASAGCACGDAHVVHMARGCCTLANRRWVGRWPAAFPCCHALPLLLLLCCGQSSHRPACAPFTLCSHGNLVGRRPFDTGGRPAGCAFPTIHWLQRRPLPLHAVCSRWCQHAPHWRSYQLHHM